MSITVTACEIEWSEAGDTFASAPPSNPACTGPAQNITLRPFGVGTFLTLLYIQYDANGRYKQSTKLRIGEFPMAKIAA